MLPAQTRISDVYLRAVDVNSLKSFYELLGFRVIRGDRKRAELSTNGSDPPQLVLSSEGVVRPRAPFAPGLFHVAYLLPGRKALALVLKHLRKNAIRLTGYADHGVSEAIYLSDPEGNGIELYRDRPREEWNMQGGMVAMTTIPLDVEGLLQEAEGEDGTPLPSGTTIGHIHLQVSDLGKAEKFYHGALGFDVTQRSYPGALFVSAGGYHHHIGLNIWNSRGARPAPEGSAGLVSFGIGIPDGGTVNAVIDRVKQAGGAVRGEEEVQDSDGILVRLRAEPT